MQKKMIAIILAVLALAIAVLGFENRQGNPKAEGLLVRNGKEETVVSWENVGKMAFEGDLVNGKGEVSHHIYEGAALLDVLKKAGAEVSETMALTATSEDNYSATLTGAEVLEDGKAYVALTRDGAMIEGIEGGQGAQLIVFGDENSKRAVRYLKTLTLGAE